MQNENLKFPYMGHSCSIADYIRAFDELNNLLPVAYQNQKHLTTTPAKWPRLEDD